MKLYMFQTVRLPIIRSLFTVHSAMIYVIHVCRQLSSRSRMERSSILTLLGSGHQKPGWDLPVLTVSRKLMMMRREDARNM